METTLTGRDAAEALGLCLRLGNAGVRVDALRALRALRTSAGRRGLSRAVTATLAPVRALAAPGRRGRSSRPSGRLRAATAPAPSRPRRSAPGETR